jgi:hypothetical protein
MELNTDVEDFETMILVWLSIECGVFVWLLWVDDGGFDWWEETRCRKRG